MERICKNCNWRDNDRECMNHAKIHELDYRQEYCPEDDHLTYSYNEDGGFYVGDNFGCVHFEPKK